MSSQRVIDTSILIGLYNKGAFETEFLHANRSAALYFSAVTIAEFVRGAHDPLSRTIVRSFLEIVQERLLTPTEQQWIESGFIAERLLRVKRRSKESILLLQNDILIALTARDTGSILITADRSDFQLLTEFIPFGVEYW